MAYVEKRCWFAIYVWAVVLAGNGMEHYLKKRDFDSLAQPQPVSDVFLSSVSCGIYQISELANLSERRAALDTQLFVFGRHTLEYLLPNAKIVL